MGTMTFSAMAERSAWERTLTGMRKVFGLFLKIVFISLLVSLAYLAEINRSEEIWTPDHSWGYGFGIGGGILMLLLLLYPLSKHWKPMRRHLSIKFWFKLHMAFGLLGPVLIFMHSSYRLGSMNSKVAFFCMLIVAISGLFGRYFYSRIHHGLYGRKATFESLRSDSAELNERLGPLFALEPKYRELLRNHETRAMTMPAGLLRLLLHWLGTRLRAVRVYPTILHGLDVRLPVVAKVHGWDAQEIRIIHHNLREVLGKHRRLIRQTQELHFYERLFAIWHLLHLPLFILLIITGLVHVYAVHAY